MNLPTFSVDSGTIGQLQTISMAQMESVSIQAVTSDPRFAPHSLGAGW